MSVLLIVGITGHIEGENKMNEIMNNALLKKCISKIDMEKLLKEIEPQLKTEIKKGLILGIKKLYWTEIILNAIENKEFSDKLSAFILNKITNSKN